MIRARVAGGPTRLAVAAFLALAAGVGTILGLGPALIVLAGGAVVGVILLLWSSLGSLTGQAVMTLDEALGLGTPTEEEEQKRAILRALKDLEYERAVGKISEEDYAALAGRYRSEAKEILRALDSDLAPMRERAEQLVRERLAGTREPPETKKGCGSCGTENDTDARFCKGCGVPLGGGGAA